MSLASKCFDGLHTRPPVLKTNVTQDQEPSRRHSKRPVDAGRRCLRGRKQLDRHRASPSKGCSGRAEPPRFRDHPRTRRAGPRGSPRRISTPMEATEDALLNNYPQLHCCRDPGMGSDRFQRRQSVFPGPIWYSRFGNPNEPKPVHRQPCPLREELLDCRHHQLNALYRDCFSVSAISPPACPRERSWNINADTLSSQNGVDFRSS